MVSASQPPCYNGVRLHVIPKRAEVLHLLQNPLTGHAFNYYNTNSNGTIPSTPQAKHRSGRVKPWQWPSYHSRVLGGMIINYQANNSASCLKRPNTSRFPIPWNRANHWKSITYLEWHHQSKMHNSPWGSSTRLSQKDHSTFAVHIVAVIEWPYNV